MRQILGARQVGSFFVSLKSLIRKSPLILKIAAPVYRVQREWLSVLPINTSAASFEGPYRLNFQKFSDKAAFDQSELGSARVRKRQRIREHDIALGRTSFSFRGLCCICRAETDFKVNSDFGSSSSPNWRESALCSRCGSGSRVRWTLHCFLQEFYSTDYENIYITEKFTETYRRLKSIFPLLVGSEYLDSNMVSGRIRRGVRHEDLQSLSFSDGKLDALLSFEVLEHVTDVVSATREISRVLRPGGRFFATVPFHIDQQYTIERAFLDNAGDIHHILEPEYHGNPTDPSGGALCFREFGWDYLDMLRDMGFESVELITFWSDELAYMGSPSIITGIKSNL